MVNVVLAQKVLDHIEQHPELHDQFGVVWEEDGNFKACIAGWTCILNGDSFGTNSADSTRSFQLMSGDNWLDRGAALLGLNPGVAFNLFCTFDNAAAVDKLKALVSAE